LGVISFNFPVELNENARCGGESGRSGHINAVSVVMSLAGRGKSVVKECKESRNALVNEVMLVRGWEGTGFCPLTLPCLLALLALCSSSPSAVPVIVSRPEVALKMPSLWR
jgi:hypothetical protein